MIARRPAESTAPPSGFPRNRPALLLAAASAILAAALAVLQAALRFAQINPDGVSYLDCGEALLRGHITALANPLWSPLYAVLAAAAERLGGLAGLPVFGALTLLNVAQFGLAAYLFVRLTRALAGGSPHDPIARSLLDFVSLGLFSAVFFLSSSLALATPDLLVCVVLLLIALQVLRIAAGADAPREFMIAGALLGASYWVKAMLFPLSLIWLAGLLWLLFSRRAPNALCCAACLLGAWLLLASPLAAAVSLRAGRVTFSEAGRLNYLWHINGVPSRPATALPAQFGLPHHSPRLIHQRPAAYAFTGPFPDATYPLWYDPAYWYRGMEPRFDAAGMWKALKQGLGGQRRLWLSRYMLPLTALALLGLLLARRQRHPGVPVLLASALSLIAMLVPLHYEPRYVTAAVLLVMAAGLAGLWRHSNGGTTWRYGPLLLLLAGSYAFAAAYLKAGAVDSTANYAQAAAALRHAGLAPGARLCVISNGKASVAPVAKAARLRIVAESSLGEYGEFLALHRSEPGALFDAFRSEGCMAVLAHPRHPSPQPAGGWRELPGTGQHILPLAAAGAR